MVIKLGEKSMSFTVNTYVQAAPPLCVILLSIFFFNCGPENLRDIDGQNNSGGDFEDPTPKDPSATPPTDEQDRDPDYHIERCKQFMNQEGVEKITRSGNNENFKVNITTNAVIILDGINHDFTIIIPSGKEIEKVCIVMTGNDHNVEVKIDANLYAFVIVANGDGNGGDVDIYEGKGIENLRALAKGNSNNIEIEGVPIALCDNSYTYGNDNLITCQP